MSSLSGNISQDWVGRRVRILRGRLAGRLGTAIQFAQGKFRIIVPGPQTIVKHASDVELLPSIPPSDDAMVGRRVTITSGSYRGNTGVVRGRARGGFYLVALTDKMGGIIVIMKKAEDIRAASRATDRTMTTAATILMQIMDRRLNEAASENVHIATAINQHHGSHLSHPIQQQKSQPDLDLSMMKEMGVVGGVAATAATGTARIPFAARAK